jgi:hypothetical protein
MKRQIPFGTGAAFFLSCLSCMSPGVAQNPAVTDGKIITGQIQIPEISGAAFLPDDRLLVVADEGQSVFLLEQATQRLLTGKVAEADFKKISLKDQLKGADGKTREVDDLEEVVWDRQSNVFLVTSHSRNRRGENVAERRAIVRLVIGSGSLKPDQVFDLEEPSELRNATERTPAQAGFNIEGAAWNQEGRLLFGLRSPTQTVNEKKRKPNEDAILLEVKDLNATPLKVTVKPVLDLKGNGIRGMFYDPEEHGLWIVAGLSPAPPDGIVEKANVSLWFRHDNGSLEKRRLPEEVKKGLANVESVARSSIGAAKQPHLLLVEDGSEFSRYALFPIPRQVESTPPTN